MAENKNRLRSSASSENKEKEQSKSSSKDKAKKKPKKPESKVGKRHKESNGKIRICIGFFFLVVSIFFLVAYASLYFGIVQEGQWLNDIGNFMTVEMFGLGTSYIIFLISILGLSLMSNKCIIKPWTLWKYSLVFLLWIPIFTSLILDYEILNYKFFGLVGYASYVFLKTYIGNVGVVLLLIFTALLYAIFTFDIKFDFLTKIKFDFLKRKKKDNEPEVIDESDDEEEDKPSEYINSNVPKPINEIKSPEIDLTDDYKGDDIEVKEEEEEKVEEEKEEKVEEEETDNDEDDVEINIDTNDEPSTDSERADDVEMEIAEQKEEKQVKENGEHFGLDTTYDPKLELSDFKLPPLDLLKDYGDGTSVIDRDELEANKKRIIDTLANYSIEIERIKATVGPTVTLYEIVPAAGVRISKIKGLQDDIALSLAALGIRIIAPIPGKGTVGIEVPNKKPQTVSMRSIIGSEKFQKCGYALPFGIGKTISNESYVADLAKMPHILMAGATGQGKSVGLNAIIASLLYSKHPAELKFILVDPKKVELSLYRKIERHYLAKLPDSEDAIITDVRKVVRTLNSLCIEMDNRYELMKDAGVRNIKEYNEKFTSRRLNPNEGHRFLPYIVLVVDEFADLIMTAGREVEGPIARLAQLARAIGIHLIIATQRPSVKIITGTIKANFPARIAFRVISRVDSATILDSNGAEQLVGRGDMLMSTGQDLVRLQCPFIDTPEVEEICEYIGAQRGYEDAYLLPDCPDEQDDGGSKESMDPNERDPLFEEAARIVVQTQQGSTSMLQRKLKLGYNRAGRIIDQLEKAGIVGPFAGSKQREVKVATEFALDQFLKDLYLDENIKNNEIL